MGVTILRSTIDGGYTLICSSCHGTCGDISEADYQESPLFWDNWKCQACWDLYNGKTQTTND